MKQEAAIKQCCEFKVAQDKRLCFRRFANLFSVIDIITQAASSFYLIFNTPHKTSWGRDSVAAPAPFRIF